MAVVVLRMGRRRRRRAGGVCLSVESEVEV